MQSDQACKAVFAGDSPLDTASSSRSKPRRAAARVLRPSPPNSRLIHMDLDCPPGRGLRRGSLRAPPLGLLAFGDLLGTLHDDLARNKVAVVAKIGEVPLLEVVLDAVDVLAGGVAHRNHRHVFSVPDTVRERSVGAREPQLLAGRQEIVLLKAVGQQRLTFAF